MKVNWHKTRYLRHAGFAGSLFRIYFHCIWELKCSGKRNVMYPFLVSQGIGILEKTVFFMRPGG